MSKSKNDINNIGSLYGDMLNSVKKTIVKESKVKEGEIGEAPLISGGPESTEGYTSPTVDKKSLTDKVKKDNLYNIDNLSYPQDLEEDEEEKEEDEIEETEEDEETEEESEESSEETEEIAQESLNNFMRKKSVFDKLYNKVMISENYGPDMGSEMEEEDLDALGIGGEGEGEDEFDLEGEGDEVTISLPRELAQQLHDALMGQLDGEDDLEGEGEDEFEGNEMDMDSEDNEMDMEEDEEDFDPGSSMNTSYNDGKKNKVGTLRTTGAGQASAKTTTCKQDSGSNMSTSYRDGKQNKVGKLKQGHSAFEQ